MKQNNTILILLPFCFLLFFCHNQKSLLEPEEQFVQIYLKYGFKNELNTFENTYQKDLVLDGAIQVTFWLTETEQTSILEKAIEFNFFSLPDTLEYTSQNDSIAVSLEPNPGVQILRIQYQSKDKTTTWTYPLNPDDSQVTDLMALNNYIISVIESKPEYKKLPPAKGGYL